MTVKEFIEKLETLPQDMNIVVVGDYMREPSARIERHAHRDLNDKLIVEEVVEIH